jgi:hypothetical protein
VCALPASHLKVHAAFEQGLADEQSVYANFFCSWRRIFCSWQRLFCSGLRDSVAKGPKFQPKKHTVKRAEKYFEGLGK